MSKFNNSRMEPNQCYRLNGHDEPRQESVVASQKFFGNQALVHVVLAQNRATAPIVNSWTTHVTRLPAGSVPVYEFRVVVWTQLLWLIMTMDRRDLYGFAIHVEEYGHAVTIGVPERKNSHGKLELFPFRGPNFYSGSTRAMTWLTQLLQS
jgi:hypothetical protein